MHHSMAVKSVAPKFIIFLPSVFRCFLPLLLRLWGASGGVLHRQDSGPQGGAGAQLLAVGQQQRRTGILCSTNPTVPAPNLGIISSTESQPICRRAYPEACLLRPKSVARTLQPPATTASLDSRDASCCGNDNLQRGL
jgi:hypothetical protein